MKKTSDSPYLKIHEDEQILVISKKSGILTIPDRYDKNYTNLLQILGSEYIKIFTVHRLDRDTSGALVYAKDAESHKFLNDQFEKKTVNKIYHAVLKGVVADDEIDIDIPIAASPAVQGMSIPSARGKESLTKLKVIERFRDATFVECQLVTGRHHQLRVHVAAIGHPLLIDEMYGDSKPFSLSEVKRKKFKLKKNTDEVPLISRITMHAYKLGFVHPITNEEVNFTAEYQKDFRAMLQVLEKYAK